MPDHKLKTYLASISAVTFSPGIMIERAERTGFICRVAQSNNPDEQIFIGFAQMPLLLVQYEKEEARQDALSKAKTFMPEEDGWTNHDVILLELPRSQFIEMQLFLTVREIYHRILRLTGFCPST